MAMWIAATLVAAGGVLSYRTIRDIPATAEVRPVSAVGVVVTLPIFDGFARENALKTARAKLDKAVQFEGLIR